MSKKTKTKDNFQSPSQIEKIYNKREEMEKKEEQREKELNYLRQFNPENKISKIDDLMYKI